MNRKGKNVNSSALQKFLNILLLLTSLIGYLEWGGGMNDFMFKVEYQIISSGGLFSELALSPLIFLPVLGQTFLLITLFQKQPGRQFTLLGIIGIGFLMSILLLVGILSQHYMVALSAVPFIAVSIIVVLHGRKKVAV